MFATPFPHLVPIKRNIESPVLLDPVQSVNDQLEQFKRVNRGARIAIAVGSRGISNLVPILKSIIRWLVDSGAEPFIIAAMGSHGGGTVEGQLAILHGYGVREEELGVPVRASIETANLFGPSDDKEVWLTKEAWEADGIILINRVKMHTDIQGAIQSGLCKLIAIGLGNRKQAEILHSEGLEALSRKIPEIASDVIAAGKILYGVAILENKQGNTAFVEVIPGEKIIEREKELLLKAIEHSSGLPVDHLDVLVIDEGGKNYAGSCIDTHVIGRMRLEGEQDLHTPVIHRIVVCDLSDHAQGNAAGIGLADFITRKFFDKIDFAPTYTNCISCIYPERGKLPIILESAESALQAALDTCRYPSRLAPRIIRIHDTLNLEKMYVSEALLGEIAAREEIEILGGPMPMTDGEGDLVSFFPHSLVRG